MRISEANRGGCRMRANPGCAASPGSGSSRHKAAASTALALVLAMGAGHPVAAQSAAGAKWADTRLSPEERAGLLVDAMTVEEQISLLRPKDASTLLSLNVPLPPSVPVWMARPKPAGAIGSAAFVPGIDRLGWPALQESDAGIGIANMGIQRPGDEATALPSSLALAAGFDPALAREAGVMIGTEAHAKGFNVQLAGGINLARDPRAGRNFEYLGEDPLLSGLADGQVIAGIQSRHVVSTIKHYAINDEETGRTVLNARISEAALRESDLLAFQIAIETGKPGAVMCSYNRVNGDYACENDLLINRILKSEWHFPGWVMSDWGAVHSLGHTVAAGLDQQSPQESEPDYFAGLADAVKRGDISAAKVRDMTFRVVRGVIAAGAFDDPARPGGVIDKPADSATAQRVEESGIVLLKNNALLPIAAKARRIVVIGGHADIGVLAGGGSSLVTPWGGLFRDAKGAGGLEVFFAPAYGRSSPLAALRLARPNALIDYDDGTDIARAADLARKADVVLVFAVQPQTEAADVPDLTLPGGQDRLIATVADANPNTAVVLETGGPVLMPWLDKVGAVLEAWYPGQRGGEAIASVATGKVSPSGRLPITFPAALSQLPRPKLDGFDPERRASLLGPPPPPFEVNYDVEGSDVGYRWFERTNAKPLFPFGFGLTYTQFRYSALKITGGNELTATFRITNTGRRSGTEIAQVYAAPPGRTHRLVGWSKVRLKPGETRTVSVHADPRLLVSWDAERRQWVRAAGSYDVAVGQAAGQSVLNGHAVLEPVHRESGGSGRR